MIAAQSNFKSGLMGLAASAVKLGTFDEVESNVAQVPTFASRGASGDEHGGSPQKENLAAAS
ncbi:hypothetical protein A176_000482 [Myxococcus hansupus]|uniref:Uncharacterized protein n=1 Tax=Pseudomyxococcus hansupus TaxID=1297742 RepID=A0A0H4WQH8_9BACT|nr:hypothetical protein A176_000482 [Myxococcus hansupus]